MPDWNIQQGLSDSRVNVTLEAMKQVQQETKEELTAEQAESKLAFQESQKEISNPFAARLTKKEKPLSAQRGRVQKSGKMGEKADRLLPLQAIKDAASQFQGRNPELKAQILVLLREQIKPDDSKEEILRKILEFYPDVSLADEALEFLLETTDGELYQKIKEIKEEFSQQNDREIAAGRNISAQARQAADAGLGTPTTLRDMYRDITGTPRDSTSLFQELSQRYPFNELKKVVSFLLHSLGSDLKSKGPSIPRGQLHRLITETRSLQAILGVYRFFQGRMNLMHSLFSKEGLDFPEQLTFEMMAKQFMSLAAERYPSADKVLQRAVKLGIEDWILAKIIAFSQFRDAVREVAMNQIYKSLQHRDELLLAIIEALEDLEDDLEEQEEKEQEEEEDKE
ncbi:negative regulator of type III secretion [Parachlamydia acanthamoebae UV-7]|jgi:type III secretion protein W|uniref:Negative regulator of type III secretion n=2 Tax=Parachlamydia acanthamoebae TaxID=83552 RepID=F8KW67_PARAV|nr:HrpJ domain-containing protein [Parachlamydia acanthamoebae]EFB40385.1 putative type III secreted protein SctW [Parachlamydia acanthamoebae str. Hall's coccus]KIA78556.1 Negative regulator of type III secretion [Parachlamydia acanthamoebae]CCB85728.1 negative regulator of type III secretion [Parachlamydia acanthamoebae UV-7]